MLKRKKKDFVCVRQQYRRVAENVNFNNINNELLEVDSNDMSSEENKNSFNSYVSDKTRNSDDGKTCFLNNTCSDVTKVNETVDFPSNNFDLKTKLAWWSTVQHNIPRSALTDLMHLLKPDHPELPLDSRTLLKTPTTTSLNSLDTGEYY